MADPTEKVLYEESIKADRLEAEIKDAEPLVVGGLVSVEAGKMRFAAPLADIIPAGYVHGSVDGNEDHLTGDAAEGYRAIARSGGIIKRVSVVGATGITDFGSLVYALDGQTFTLSAGFGKALGFVRRYISGTLCDVQLFTLAESILIKVL